MEKEGTKGQYIYDLLAEWGVMLTENKLAHVIFISDNPSSIRFLGKVLNHKSPELFYLEDASISSSLEFLQSRLPTIASHDLSKCAATLGGRFADLDLLSQKITSGRTPEIALKDMLNRAISELRKIGLQEDASDATVGWSPIQFWNVITLLSKHTEVPFDSVKINAMFKGDS